MQVPLYKSQILDINVPIQKVSMGNPDIADILVLRNGQLYVLGKKLGTTNVLLWNKNSQLIKAIDIEVTHDLNTLKAKLFRVLPDERIEVYSSQGSLVLGGQVSSTARMNTALKIAQSYVSVAQRMEGDGKAKEDKENRIVNLMSVGGAQQVMLKVTVAEMNRSSMKKLGVKFNALGIGDSNWNLGGVNGGATFPDALFEPDDVRIPVFGESAPLGPVIDEFMPNDLSIADKGLFGSFLSENFIFNMTLEAAKENGSAKILAEPTLTTLTGQEARFLSGGEFPIPIPRGDRGTTIEFKEFGVGVNFVPVVLDSGRINLTLDVSVSELINGNSVIIRAEDSTSTFLIPSLTKRSAQSSVELADGETIGIAGLISENMREVVTKFPGLGDIPILGQLFRSSEFESGETELVILVTPVLATPFKDKPALPTDHFVAPSDLEFYLLGRTYGTPEKSGTKSTSTAQTLPVKSGGIDQSFGHSLN
ncbi:type II and III secretion system protein family protein [Aestuariicella hydrocarbonica]|uniref:Type II and III secretion system protein family protein n=2 Tax=Pseudomaricurvus hydrocarbonicus TaxID=1470433 RepID=A0A9E5MMU3_9GAMM|nr:type II and III secretion system protein family protein [Aestuariicella hydrocarbonica]